MYEREQWLQWLGGGGGAADGMNMTGSTGASLPMRMNEGSIDDDDM